MLGLYSGHVSAADPASSPDPPEPGGGAVVPDDGLWTHIERAAAIHPRSEEKMPNNSGDPRFHLSLLDRGHLIEMANLEPGVRSAYGTAYHQADEFDDDVLRNWLDLQLLASVAKNGERAKLLVEAMLAKRTRLEVDSQVSTRPPMKESL